MRLPVHMALMASALVLASCGSGDNPLRSGDDPEILEGEVTFIRNDIPVDGGITIEVQVEQATETLAFPSLFTDPPPSEEVLRLYDVVRRVELGDVVRAEGVRQNGVLALQKLWILDGRP